MSKSRRTNKIIWKGGVGLAGICFLIAGSLGVYDYFQRTQTGPVIPDAQKIVMTANSPSEKKPVISDEYRVSKDQPRRITIPSISVEAYVEKVGTSGNGDMATPNNIYFTGWYTGSVSPGEKGVSIIDGHAGGRYRDGVFARLHSLKVNDMIGIEMGDTSWRNFEVISVDSYTVNSAAVELYKSNPAIEKELHLITCEGTFDSKTNTYDKRGLIIAKYVK